MADDPAWHLYRSLLAVLREGSLSAAARRLRLTQPTVGRHIDELEAALAVTLFTRAQDGFRPTPVALALRPMAEAMETAAAAMVRQVSAVEDTVQGAVRITASEVMGAEVLPPLLAAIRGVHPHLVIELVLTNRMENLVRRDADIAVRMGRPQQNAILARRLGAVALGFFAHKSYLAAHGPPGTMAELLTRHLIGFDQDDRSARSIVGAALAIDRDRFAVRSDSDLAQQAAVRAGLGIGVMQHRLAARHADLVPVLADTYRFELDVWLAMHEDHQASRLIRTVFDALGEQIGVWLRDDVPSAPTPPTPA